mmetsp:Transcript_54862/g.175929  ORF Transcript_54862/g.175929 Transcript_54862/m.175929 type:complete len:256 (+) Transcript_54862:653-1420(+)
MALRCTTRASGFCPLSGSNEPRSKAAASSSSEAASALSLARVMREPSAGRPSMKPQDGSSRENSSCEEKANVGSGPTDVSAREHMCCCSRGSFTSSPSPPEAQDRHRHVIGCPSRLSREACCSSSEAPAATSSRPPQRRLSSVTSEAAREAAPLRRGLAGRRASTPGGGMERRARARQCCAEERCEALHVPTRARREGAASGARRAQPSLTQLSRLRSSCTRGLSSSAVMSSGSTRKEERKPQKGISSTGPRSTV